MTRLSLITSTILMLLSGQVSADQSVRYDASKLSDPAYVSKVRDRIREAAASECRATYRGDWEAQSKIRTCVRETSERALDELDEARRITLAAAE